MGVTEEMFTLRNAEWEESAALVKEDSVWDFKMSVSHSLKYSPTKSRKQKKKIVNQNVCACIYVLFVLGGGVCSVYVLYGTYLFILVVS